MATEHVMITDLQVFHARGMAERRETPDGKAYIYSDAKLTGLQLKVQGGKAGWYVRNGDNTLAIGTAYPDSDTRSLLALSRVREIAEATLAYLRNGNRVKVAPFLAAYYEKRIAWDGTHSALVKAAMTVVETAIEEEAERKRHRQSWTFRQCVERAVSDKSAKNASAAIGDETVKDYWTTFNRPIFQDALNKAVTELTAHDIENVRDWVKENSGPSPAKKVVTYTRSVLNHCCSNHSASGLNKSDPWWRMLSAPWVIAAKARKPGIRDIVASLLLAEEYLSKPLPGRMIETAGVRSGTLAALWWLVLTCQRADAGLSLLGHDVVDDALPNFKLAAWGEGIMKAGRAHILPIPVAAWQVINGFREKGKNSSSGDWIFPSERDPEKHVTSSGVYRILYRLAARDALIQGNLEQAAKEKALERKKAGKEPRKRQDRSERRDLFKEHGIGWWSPHDLRRSITSVLNEAGIPGGASAILAHEIDEKEGLHVVATERERDDFMRQRAAKITAMAYGRAQYLGLKREALSIWCDVVLGEYQRQKQA